MSNSKLIDTLKAASGALAQQDKQTAINTLQNIAGEVAIYKSSAALAEGEAKRNQQATNIEISELIKQQGKAHDESNKAKRDLDTTRAEITSKEVSINDLDRRIRESNDELNRCHNDLRGCEARIADLNDTSAWSIFVSVITLGLDRAIKAISIEIDGIRDRINSLRNTIGRYDQELRRLQGELFNDRGRVAQLAQLVERTSQQIRDLDYLEFKLHNQEEQQRKRLVFFTEMNMFYIRVQNLLDNISNRLGDVRDIVNELDNQTPTIANFDPTGKDLISLKEAIIKFEETVPRRKMLRMVAAEVAAGTYNIFDPNKWYYITNEWLGIDQPLTAGSGRANKVDIGEKNSKPTQLWRIEATNNGYYKVTSKSVKGDKMLDIDGDHTTDFRPVTDEQATDAGQFWKIEPEFEYFRLSSRLLGEGKSLDVVKDGNDYRLTMGDSANTSGQHWKIVPVE